MSNLLNYETPPPRKHNRILVLGLSLALIVAMFVLALVHRSQPQTGKIVISVIAAPGTVPSDFIPVGNLQYTTSTREITDPAQIDAILKSNAKVDSTPDSLPPELMKNIQAIIATRVSTQP